MSPRPSHSGAHAPVEGTEDWPFAAYQRTDGRTGSRLGGVEGTLELRDGCLIVKGSALYMDVDRSSGFLRRVRRNCSPPIEGLRPEGLSGGAALQELDQRAHRGPGAARRVVGAQVIIHPTTGVIILVLGAAFAWRMSTLGLDPVWGTSVQRFRGQVWAWWWWSSSAASRLVYRCFFGGGGPKRLFDTF